MILFLKVNSMSIKSKHYLFSSNPGKAHTFPTAIQFLFFVFAIYLVLPIVDLPLLGLSISAPLFFIVALHCFFRPPEFWLHEYRLWIVWSLFIWAGIFLSSTLNGLLSGGVNINADGIAMVIRYAYWMIVFVITSYFVSRAGIEIKLTHLLALAIFFLSLLRFGEAVFYGKIGAWVNPILLSQNDYGFLFSSFSPFLFVLMLSFHGAKKFWVIWANAFLWLVVAINGSRSSWIAIVIGIGFALVMLARSKPKEFTKLLILSVFAGIAFGLVYVNVPQFSDAIMGRFDTFDRLESEKSYMIRQLMNQKAVRLFEESPLIGVGTARFRISTTPLDIPDVLLYASQSHFDRRSAHNSYLGFLAENGLVVFLPYALLVVFLLWKGMNISKSYIEQNQYWALAILLSFVQMSIHMWSIYALANTVSWFVYGLVAALIMLQNKGHK